MVSLPPVSARLSVVEGHTWDSVGWKEACRDTLSHNVTYHIVLLSSFLHLGKLCVYLVSITCAHVLFYPVLSPFVPCISSLLHVCTSVLPSVATNSYPSLDMHVLASMLLLHLGIVWCLQGIMVDSTTVPPASESARINMNGEAVKRTDGDKDPGPDVCSYK